MLYIIQANRAVQDGESTRFEQLPSFYVEASSEDNAEVIAERILGRRTRPGYGVALSIQPAPDVRRG